MEKFCDSLTRYSRRETVAVQIGNTAIGGDHSLGRIAVALHDGRGQRTVVDADTQRGSPSFADGQQFVELTALVVEVAGVDPYFLDMLRRDERRRRQKMDVGHERHAASPAVEQRADTA